MALIFLNSLMVVILSNCLHKAHEFAAYISPNQSLVFMHTWWFIPFMKRGWTIRVKIAQPFDPLFASYIS